LKTLIIGGTSVIGRALEERLQSLGPVHTAGRVGADITIDLSDPHVVLDLDEQFDVVVHAAADFGGDGDEDLIRAEMVNTLGSLKACQLAHRTKASQFVFLSTTSSSYVSGDSHYGIYSISKRHAEELVTYYCSLHGIPYVILRPTQVVDAPGACRCHQRFFYMVADFARENREVMIFGGHDAVRNYLFLDDLVEVVFRAIERTAVGIYTCAHPNWVRLSEVIEAAFSANGRAPRIKWMPDKPDIADLPITKDDTLYDLIEYVPQVDIGEAMRRIKLMADGGQ